MDENSLFWNFALCVSHFSYNLSIIYYFVYCIILLFPSYISIASLLKNLVRHVNGKKSIKAKNPKECSHILWIFGWYLLLLILV